MTRIALLLFGFAAAFVGDWFLAIRRCGVTEPGFLCGIAAFACAHLLWSAANWKESKVAWMTLPVVLLPVAGFFVARVHGQVPEIVWRAALAYAAVSAVSLAVAIGTRRWFYSLGIGCLVLSDVFIACTWVRAPHCGSLIGPTYIAALVLLAVSLVCGQREARFACGNGNPLPMTALGGLMSAGFFVWAMIVCPGGGYNPLTYMLSYLGRTEIRDVAYPLSHYLFCLGMVVGSGASLYFSPYFQSLAPGRIRKEVIGWGMAICVGGLLLITMVPENENMAWHLNGCYLTMIGGIPMAFALAFDRMGKIVFGWMALVAVAFETVLALDKADVLPFAPYVPTLQKTIIVSFMLWQLCYAFRIGGGRPCGRVEVAEKSEFD